MGLRSTRTCSRASGVAPSWGGGGTLTACPLHPQGQAQRPLPPGWGGWTDGQMPILARIEEALKKILISQFCHFFHVYWLEFFKRLSS